ncbi:hypothetical protein BV20DRAFT_553922 [Pilatotrama ljubarskyi]|nr:hypothetical protein BV20DRAFT_553922 [Pilatotrama ljubarskyi]
MRSNTVRCIRLLHRIATASAAAAADVRQLTTAAAALHARARFVDLFPRSVLPRPARPESLSVRAKRPQWQWASHHSSYAALTRDGLGPDMGVRGKSQVIVLPRSAHLLCAARSPPNIPQLWISTVAHGVRAPLQAFQDALPELLICGIWHLQLGGPCAGLSLWRTGLGPYPAG